MPRALLLLFLAAAGCGSTPASPADAGTADASAGSGTKLHFGPCTAALQSGAPTPTRGYCPTGAGLTALAAPRKPSVAWTRTLVPQENPENYLPFEIVVDASGRAYVGVYSSPISPTTHYEIVGIDPDGTVAWTTPLPSPAGSTAPAPLAIGRDGTIWGPADQSADYPDANDGPTNAPAVLLGLGRDGSVAERIQVTPPPGVPEAGLPSCGDVPCGPLETPDADFDNGPGPADFAVSGIDGLAIGSDGSFFVLATSVQPTYETGPFGIARISADGATAWAWSNLNFVAQAPLYLTPTDGVVATTSRGLTADGSPALLSLTAQGATGWLADASAIEILDPGGNPVGISQAFPSGELTLTRLDAATGNIAMQTTLGSQAITFDATHLAVASDGTILVLLAYEAPSPGDTQTHLELLAVDPGTGVTRWTSTFDFRLVFNPSSPGGHFGLFVDPAGTIVLTAGAVRGVDLATGSVLWTVPAPNESACLQPAVLGANRSIFAAQCDGSVFMARDP